MPRPVVPDPEEGVEREEGAPGRDRVVVQGRPEDDQIGAEPERQDREEPGPVVAGVAVEEPGIQDQGHQQRHHVQQHHHRVEVEDVRRPLDRLLRGHVDDPVAAILVDLQDLRRVLGRLVLEALDLLPLGPLLGNRVVERHAGPFADRPEDPGDHRRQQRGLAGIEVLLGLALGPRGREGVGQQDLVLGLQLPGALVDRVGPALQEGPDGRPPRDVVGRDQGPLVQRRPQRERDRADDHELADGPPGPGPGRAGRPVVGAPHHRLGDLDVGHRRSVSGCGPWWCSRVEVSAGPPSVGDGQAIGGGVPLGADPLGDAIGIFGAEVVAGD